MEYVSGKDPDHEGLAPGWKPAEIYSYPFFSDGEQFLLGRAVVPNTARFRASDQECESPLGRSKLLIHGCCPRDSGRYGVGVIGFGDGPLSGPRAATYLQGDLFLPRPRIVDGLDAVTGLQKRQETAGPPRAATWNCRHHWG